MAAKQKRPGVNWKERCLETERKLWDLQEQKRARPLEETVQRLRSELSEFATRQKELDKWKDAAFAAISQNALLLKQDSAVRKIVEGWIARVKEAPTRGFPSYTLRDIAVILMPSLARSLDSKVSFEEDRIWEAEIARREGAITTQIDFGADAATEIGRDR